MIAYFDTSGLVPLIIEEPGSQVAARIWDEVEDAISVRLVYVEAHAALPRAQRLGRVSATQLIEAVAELDDLYAQIGRIGIDEALTRRGGELDGRTVRLATRLIGGSFASERICSA